MKGAFAPAVFREIVPRSAATNAWQSALPLKASFSA